MCGIDLNHWYQCSSFRYGTQKENVSGFRLHSPETPVTLIIDQSSYLKKKVQKFKDFIRICHSCVFKLLPFSNSVNTQSFDLSELQTHPPTLEANEVVTWWCLIFARLK